MNDTFYGPEIWDYQWEQPVIVQHIYLIQNTVATKPAREDILSFLEEDYKHDSNIYPYYFIDYGLFDEKPYLSDQESSSQNNSSSVSEETVSMDEVKAPTNEKSFNIPEKEDCTIESLPIDELFVDCDCECTNLSLLLETPEETNPVFLQSLSKGLNCVCHTENSAGLETLKHLLGPIQSKVSSIQSDFTHRLCYISFIGDGNDLMFDKTEVLARIVQCEYTESHHLTFYRWNDTGKIDCVGKSIQGAAKLFNLSSEEITQAKEMLASLCPEYSSRWEKEKREQALKCYNEYRHQLDKLEPRLSHFTHYTAITKPIKTSDLTLYDHHYRDLDDFLSGERLLWGDYGYTEHIFSPSITLMKNRKGQLYLKKIKGYPCFDSYDYAHETRYYATIFICDTIEEAYQKFVMLSNKHRWRTWPDFMGTILEYDSGTGKLEIIQPLDKELTREHLFSSYYTYEEILRLRKNAPPNPCYK